MILATLVLQSAVAIQPPTPPRPTVQIPAGTALTGSDFSVVPFGWDNAPTLPPSPSLDFRPVVPPEFFRSSLSSVEVPPVPPCWDPDSWAWPPPPGTRIRQGYPDWTIATGLLSHEYADGYHDARTGLIGDWTSIQVWWMDGDGTDTTQIDTPEEDAVFVLFGRQACEVFGTPIYSHGFGYWLVDWTGAAMDRAEWVCENSRPWFGAHVYVPEGTPQGLTVFAQPMYYRAAMGEWFLGDAISFTTQADVYGEPIRRTAEPGFDWMYCK